MITSLIREFRCFFWSQPGHAVEQLVKQSEIWDTMTLDHVAADSHIGMGNFISAGIVITKITCPARELDVSFGVSPEMVLNSL